MNRCPQCASIVQTVVARPDSRDPCPGDLIVCLACGAICLFSRTFELRIVRPEDARSYDPLLMLKAMAVSDAILAGRQRRH